MKLDLTPPPDLWMSLALILTIAALPLTATALLAEFGVIELSTKGMGR